MRFERIRSPTVVRSIAVLVALPLALVGCGGGSSSSANGARSQFITRANGICRNAQKKAKPLVSGEKRLNPKTFDAAVALLNRTANELAAVKAPADLRAGYERFLALANEETAVVAKLAQYLHEHNRVGIHSLEGQLHGHAVNGLARQLGLTVCAEEVT
jgi:hypothetical protein